MQVPFRPILFRTGPRSHHGFTLIEMLAAIAVLCLISVFMISLSDQAGRLWSRGEMRNQHRQRARAALDFIARDLRLAYLGVSRDNTPFQFVINPSIGPESKNHDSVFWQAPIATDVAGGLAEIGYFVRWEDNKATLCRYFVNPSDPAYLIYRQPGNWLDLSAVAPANKAGAYRGLFLENVLGMWVKATRTDGTPYAGDSRLEGNQLPGRVDISLVLLSEVGASRMKGAPADAAALHALVTSSATADELMQQLPDWCKPYAGEVSLSVSLDHAP